MSADEASPVPDLLTGLATTRAIRRIAPDPIPDDDLVIRDPLPPVDGTPGSARTGLPGWEPPRRVPPIDGDGGMRGGETGGDDVGGGEGSAGDQGTDATGGSAGFDGSGGDVTRADDGCACSSAGGELAWSHLLGLLPLLIPRRSGRRARRTSRRC